MKMPKKKILFSVLAIFTALLFLCCGKPKEESELPTVLPSESVTETASASEEKEETAEESTETASASEETEETAETTSDEITVTEDGEYHDKEHVAFYIHRFGKLPRNYITKEKAEKLGWKSAKGNLMTVAPGKSIGGNVFGNRGKQLPEKKGRKYYECDIDYQSGIRNAKRIVYSNDGLIFYTEDHYKTFEQLY